MKKILHLLWSGNWGGAERFVHDVALYSDPNRFEHHICFCGSGGLVYEEMNKQGLKVYVVGMKNGFDILKGIRLFSIIKTIRPDIINVHMAPFLVYLLFLIFPRLKKIFFEHGKTIFSDTCSLLSIREKLDFRFYKHFANTYDVIIANSNHTKDSIIRINPQLQNKIVTCYIGVDMVKYQISVDKEKLKHKLGLPISKKIVGIVARLSEEKGVDDFIKIADLVAKKRDDVCFLVVGDGVLREKLETSAKLSSADIRFLGARSDVPELLHLFDVFLFTSKSEAFGIALIEALASGVPIIGFGLPGAKEIIDLCGGGILWDTRSHEMIADILCDRLNTIHSLITPRVQEKIFQNFSISHTISNLEKIYQSL